MARDDQSQRRRERSAPKLAGWLVGILAGLCVAAILGSLIPPIGEAEHFLTQSSAATMSESDDR